MTKNNKLVVCTLLGVLSLFFLYESLKKPITEKSREDFHVASVNTNVRRLYDEPVLSIEYDSSGVGRHLEILRDELNITYEDRQDTLLSRDSTQLNYRGRCSRGFYTLRLPRS